MGWRLGQGIGPRISLKQRKAQDALAYQPTTGTRYTGHTLELPDDDEEASRHTYAPRDTPVLHVNRKDNSHGLGYLPGLSLNESLGGNSGGSQGPRLAGMFWAIVTLHTILIKFIKGGFGLGALNDAEDDDLDVYDHSHQQSRRRLAYDHLDGDDDDTVVIGGKGDKKNIVHEVCLIFRLYGLESYYWCLQEVSVLSTVFSRRSTRNDRICAVTWACGRGSMVSHLLPHTRSSLQGTTVGFLYPMSRRNGHRTQKVCGPQKMPAKNPDFYLVRSLMESYLQIMWVHIWTWSTSVSTNLSVGPF